MRVNVIENANTKYFTNTIGWSLNALNIMRMMDSPNAPIKNKNTQKGTTTAVIHFQTYQIISKLRNATWIDEEGELKPDNQTIAQAEVFISDLYNSVLTNNISWKEPLVNASPHGELVFEWWNAERKLTIYLKNNSMEFIQVWGADIDNEMQDGVLTADLLPRLFGWLEGR